MDSKKILPTVIGYAAGLVGIYILVRVVSAAWSKGQK
jgi:hypothetical protein